MPRISIGIPTYNRSRTMKRSIESALDQSHPDVEVIVVDDASSDDTPEVARSFGDRIRYLRNEPNIGMWPNFARTAQVASGDYFSWLQDDEMIHHDYARRAVEALDSDQELAMYSAYSVDTYSVDTFVLPVIIGPPVTMNWMKPRVRVIDGTMVLPISLFLTFSMPPITAYRTEVIREAIKDLNPESILFNERIIQSKAVDRRKIAVDPFLGGTFYKHETQGSLLAGSSDLAERSRQWVNMANEIGVMMEGRPTEEWSPLLDAWLESISPHDIIQLRGQLAPPAYWSSLSPLAFEICSRILPLLPDDLRHEHEKALTDDGKSKNLIKDLGRQVTPPLFWNLLRKIKAESRRVSPDQGISSSPKKARRP